MEQLGRYKLVRKLAQGGMAEVFLAQVEGAAGFSRPVALKRILPELSGMAEVVAMFQAEARLAAVLDHPNVVQTLDFGQVAGGFFIAMEYVEGTSLKGLIRAARGNGQLLPLAETLKIAALACEGLAHAHEAVNAAKEPLGLIHRDISPDNLLLSFQGAVKVADFGIAKVASLPRVTQTGVVKGKVPYMAPEVLRGKPFDSRADVWAMGVTLFEALAGTRPFGSGGGVSAARANLEDPPRDLCALTGASESLRSILERALEKDPAQRIPTARDLRNELEAELFALGRPVGSAEIGALVRQFAPPTAAEVGSPEAGVPPAAAAAINSVATSPSDAVPTVQTEVSTAIGRPRLLHRATVILARAVGVSDALAAEMTRAAVVFVLLCVAAIAGVLYRAQMVGPATEWSVTVIPTPGDQLIVESTPPGAEVLFGDRVLGDTPLHQRNSLPPGASPITVRVGDGEPVVVLVAGGRGQTVTLVRRD